MMHGQFAEKVAFITGGATGLGRDFARALSRRGAAVAIVDVDYDRAKVAAAEIHASESPAVAVACDVADAESVDEAVRGVVGELGGVDVLINNAALHMKQYNRPFGVQGRQDIRDLFDVNVMGVIHCSLGCRDSMRERGGGAIVNMASLAAFSSTTPYGVTKLAVRGLTNAFATEFGSDGIRVNAIAPTITPTENVVAEYGEADIESKMVSLRQLVPRPATMEDVTKTMLFLCSDEASFITGETIRVTGGSALSL